MLARIVALSLALAAPAFAANPTPPPAPSADAPKLDRAEAKLEKHIAKAAAKGKITQTQAAQLQQELNKVRADEAQMSKDGLSKDERKALRQELHQVKLDLRADVKQNGTAKK
jgi:hypothetical protein